MSQVPPRNVILQAAKLSAYMDRCTANGTAPNPEYVTQLNNIKTLAQTRLNPAQYQMAMHEMDMAKVRIQESANTETQRLHVADQQHKDGLRSAGLAAALRQGTKNMTVGPIETVEDFQKIRKGLPLTVSTGRHSLPKAALAEQVKKKYGTTLDQHIRRLDICAGIEDDEKREATMKHFGLDHKTVKDWAQGGGIQYGLQEKMSDQDDAAGIPDTVEIQPSEGDILRADIMGSMAEHDGVTPFDELEEWADTAKDRLGEDSLAGDLTRAWLVTEERDNIEAIEAEAGV